MIKLNIFILQHNCLSYWTCHLVLDCNTHRDRLHSFTFLTELSESEVCILLWNSQPFQHSVYKDINSSHLGLPRKHIAYRMLTSDTLIHLFKTKSSKSEAFKVIPSTFISIVNEKKQVPVLTKHKFQNDTFVTPYMLHYVRVSVRSTASDFFNILRTQSTACENQNLKQLYLFHIYPLPSFPSLDTAPFTHVINRWKTTSSH